MTPPEPIDYTAHAASPIVNGEVKLKITETSFVATALFDVVEVPYAMVNSIELVDYVITVRTDDGNYVFTKMGRWVEPFYDALCASYGRAVLRSFFVSGDPMLAAAGDYRFTEDGAAVNGIKAPIQVYRDCVVSLPPNGNGRRIPLCFIADLDRGSFDLTMKLSGMYGGTGNTYAFSKLGYDTGPFANMVEKNIRALRDKTLAELKEFDPTLTTAQYSELAKLMPEGTAAQMGMLSNIAPSFVKAVDAKIAKTRGGASYKTFKELCDPGKIWIGFRKKNAREDGTEVADEDESVTEPFLFWMIVPSPDGQFATVEFAEANTATFVYRTGGDFHKTSMLLNRALEAISFKREVIRLTDEELLKPYNADYYMAAKRTASLQYIRSNFVARIVHATPESWKRKLLEVWDGRIQGTPLSNVKICGKCGARSESEDRFCGQCGERF
jgi:hypothetical protein